MVKASPQTENIIEALAPLIVPIDSVLEDPRNVRRHPIACEKLGRRCYMLEIAPCYCDVIIQRWQNYTGQQAARL